ncbi:MAG: methylated-DNA--[protein]-cysteine S-methyltransferase [Candidatus Hodarchaeota archaeon]
MDPRTCIPLDGIDDVKICFKQNSRDGMIDRILFRIKDFNDQECEECIKYAERDRAAFTAQEIVEAISNLLQNKTVLDLSSLPVETMVNQFKTRFKRDVISAPVNTKPGQTVTYGELASLANHPGSARAVGNTMRNNPYPIIIPCHRVVSSTGLGGFGGNKHPMYRKIKLHLQDLEKKVVER